MVDTDLTTEDVAAALRLNKATVQRLLKAGRMSGYQIGRSWRVPASSLDAFRAHGSRVDDNRRTPIVPQPNFVNEDYDQWEELLLAEDDLADAPAIPLEAMRRENIYQDRR